MRAPAILAETSLLTSGLLARSAELAAKGRAIAPNWQNSFRVLQRQSRSASPIACEKSPMRLTNRPLPKLGRLVKLLPPCGLRGSPGILAYAYKRIYFCNSAEALFGRCFAASAAHRF